MLQRVIEEVMQDRNQKQEDVNPERNVIKLAKPLNPKDASEDT